jgi:phosphotransferase system HPr-like phosphotransfer protein
VWEEKIMATTFNIQLNSINDVKVFVNTVNKYAYDIDLTSGRYVVDAKSIMGIFSLDLSKPIKVEIFDENCGELVKELEQFNV